MIRHRSIAFVLLTAFAFLPIPAAPSVTLRVDGNAPRVAVSQSLFGIFFEEINHAGAGSAHRAIKLVAPRFSYYMQRMLAPNRPDEILPTQRNPGAEPKSADLFTLAGFERKTGTVLLRVVNRSLATRDVRVTPAR